MSWKMTPFAAAIVVAGGIAATSAGFAQNPPPSTPAPQGQGMMSGTGDMNNMMGQMTRMMDNCNRMMESANQKPAAPATPPVQGKPG